MQRHAHDEARQQVEDLRRARDRGLGEEGRTKEEQDRAMSGEPLAEDEKRRLTQDPDTKAIATGAPRDPGGR